ncbi:MAG: MBL fold metallo-hydrolase [Candidatus Pacearchaeota archaeon]|nr:MBL fold metallo-hydrolase [Candidatus Pacearchaeota archaeon]
MYKEMKIHAISGYSEVGKNMTALDLNDDVVLFDSGLFLPSIVGVAEREKIPTEKGMRELGALPDDLYLEKKRLREKVRAILVSHAHLDHLGALPFNAYRYNADIVSTPFSIEVLKLLLEDSNQRLKNRLIPINPNSSFIIKGKRNAYKAEFINITHSTLQTALIAVHTPNGIIMYANDFKLDNTPLLGDKPNFKRIKELAKEGVKALIFDSLYASDDRKTPSEKIAKGLLEDVFFTTENRNSAMIITTFSSHISRLKTIAELGEKLNREVYFIGRSLNKYLTAARNIHQAKFAPPHKIISFKKQIEKFISKVNKNKNHYLLVCTGHQGEPGSILDRIARHELPLHLSKDDQIIFSSKTIPTPINETNRKILEKHLRKYNVRIFDNVHVSGHGGREDLRDFIKMINPEHLIPAHGDLKKLNAGIELAEEIGYKLNKNAHLMQNGKSITLK